MLPVDVSFSVTVSMPDRPSQFSTVVDVVPSLSTSVYEVVDVEPCSLFVVLSVSVVVVVSLPLRSSHESN